MKKREFFSHFEPASCFAFYGREKGYLSLGTRKNLFRVVPGFFIYVYNEKNSKVYIKGRHKPEQKNKPYREDALHIFLQSFFYFRYEAAFAASLASFCRFGFKQCHGIDKQR